MLFLPCCNAVEKSVKRSRDLMAESVILELKAAQRCANTSLKPNSTFDNRGWTLLVLVLPRAIERNATEDRGIRSFFTTRIFLGLHKVLMGKTGATILSHTTVWAHLSSQTGNPERNREKDVSYMNEKKQRQEKKRKPVVASNE